MINKIKLTKPDVIYAIVVGGSNVAFYKQLKAAGISLPKEKPLLLTISVTEDEILGIGGENMEGAYASMKYFQSLDNPNNKAFVEAFKAKNQDPSGPFVFPAYAAVQVIAEGIELQEELVVLASMGIDLVQGYLLGRPMELPPQNIDEVLPQSEVQTAFGEETGNLSALLIQQPAMSADRPVAEMLEAFRLQPNLNSIAVLDTDARPVGIIHRNLISDALLKPYATDLTHEALGLLLSGEIPWSQHCHRVDDIATAREFYGGVLGLSEGRSDTQWVDWNFYGHQVVTHQTAAGSPGPAGHNPVDDHQVPVPHFGAVLSYDDFHDLAGKMKAAGATFVIEPYLRFEGQAGEQWTMFFLDPAGNAMEFKAFADESQIFAK